MKITKSYLKKVIKEELSHLSEQSADVQVKYVDSFQGGNIAGVTVAGRSGSVVLTKDGEVRPTSRLGELTPDQKEQIKTSAMEMISSRQGQKVKESQEDVRSERDRLSKLFRNFQGQVKNETGFIAGQVKTQHGALSVSLTPTHDTGRSLGIPVKEYIVRFHGENPNVMYKDGSWEVQYSGGGEDKIIAAAKKIKELDSKLDKTSKY
jgi:hypothetical protein